ncbi:hypothetical protein DOTSEDRAFT_74299 [Dothistroma septosporum NZE10]|uniref:Uncharacterized protein n=1 Tax=Dothistroma septosporum (strain NZE10 / CBS 128990) TaxID=675120 RepID=N1PF52_DOTSN|nr:hypothetical protein DOTSEDRAFT_74299 [Dothistroma septosporum NZE10]
MMPRKIEPSASETVHLVIATASPQIDLRQRRLPMLLHGTQGSTLLVRYAVLPKQGRLSSPSYLRCGVPTNQGYNLPASFTPGMLTLRLCTRFIRTCALPRSALSPSASSKKSSSVAFAISCHVRP